MGSGGIVGRETQAEKEGGGWSSGKLRGRPAAGDFAGFHGIAEAAAVWPPACSAGCLFSHRARRRTAHARLRLPPPGVLLSSLALLCFFS